MSTISGLSEVCGSPMPWLADKFKLRVSTDVTLLRNLQIICREWAKQSFSESQLMMLLPGGAVRNVRKIRKLAD